MTPCREARFPANSTPEIVRGMICRGFFFVPERARYRQHPDKGETPCLC
jgi:hypothetical protein